MRLTSEQDALIRRAAEVEGTDLTNFAVTTLLGLRRDVLADRAGFSHSTTRRGRSSRRRWTSRCRVSHGLRSSFAEPSIFDDSEA